MYQSFLLLDLLFFQIDLSSNLRTLWINYFYSYPLISCKVIHHYLNHIYLYQPLLHPIASLKLSSWILLYHLGYLDFLFSISLICELTLFFLFLKFCNHEPTLHFFLLMHDFRYLYVVQLKLSILDYVLYHFLFLLDLLLNHL